MTLIKLSNESNHILAKVGGIDRTNFEISVFLESDKLSHSCNEWLSYSLSDSKLQHVYSIVMLVVLM
jgi:hypothetical protein